MRISDWSSDVCSSDLRDVIIVARDLRADAVGRVPAGEEGGKVGRVIDMAESVGEGAVGEGGDRLGIGGLCQLDERHAASPVNPAGAGQPGAVKAITLNNSPMEIGRASCRERVCQYV